MEFFDIAAEAAQRWSSRSSVRVPRVDKIRAGRGMEVESPERIQLRFNRLSEYSRKSQLSTLRQGGAAPAGQLVETIGLERVIGRPDFLDMNFVELALAVGRFVGRIVIRTAQGRAIGYGTGFMVSPSLLMTNHHVLEDVATAQNSQVEFDFQNDRYGRPLPIAGFRLDPATFFLTSAALDFSLVAVSELAANGAPLQRYGWSRLVGDQGKALLGEPLNIIQHPRGEAKQIVLRSNELVDLFDQYAHYVTDTEPGSSGSPVYNDQWELVALHHSGIPKKDDKGNFIAKDGSIWTSGMDPDNLDWVANEGIRVSSLVDYIGRQPFTGRQAKLRDDLLNLEPPAPLEAAVAGQVGAAGGASNTVQGSGPSIGAPIVAGASDSWTIPLTVTVQLGSGAAGQPVAIAPAPTPAPTSVVLPTSASTPGPSSSSPELQRALAELENAKTREYYDAEDDQRSCKMYYDGLVLADDLGENYEQLAKLLESTHKNRLSYNPAQQLYPWVDLHQAGDQQNIVSIYSGKTFSAKELIETDFAIMEARRAMRESFKRPALPGQESSFDEDALEAAMPYNCEHVVPQSWFMKKEPMRGDLHHLFGCESGCNSFRGNTPYFDFTDFGEVVREDCGKRETGRFEPSSGKGAVARATLYFLLRYPGQINSSMTEYTRDRIAMLLNWHATNEVTEYERHRNAAIFEKQGNRNPLIDFPKIASRIDFEKGLG